MAKNDGKVKIGIELDSSKFDKAIKDLKKDSNNAGKSVAKDFQSSDKSVGKSFESISKSAKSSASKIGSVFSKTKIGKAIQVSTHVASKALHGLVDVAKGTANAIKNVYNKIPESVKKSVVGVGKLMTAGVTAGATAVGGILSMGAKYNSDMQNYMANFRVMLGDQEKATQRVNELKEMASKTPFGMEDLAEATQTLLAFQVPANQTNDVLKMLGDISLGNKEKLSSLALVFGQVSSAGRLTGQDLMQFVNAGFNPLNYIAQRTGESMEELRDRMSKGAVSVEEVKQAFVDATSKGGQFYKGMEEASKTLSGQMSTLKDNTNELMGKIAEEFTKGMSEEVTPQALDSIQRLSEAFEEEGIDGLIEASTNILVEMVNNMVEKAPLLLEQGGAIIQNLLLGIAEHKEELFESIKQLFFALVDIFLELLPTFIDVALQLIGTIAVGLIDALPELLAKVPEIIQILFDTFIGALGILKDIGVKIVEKIWEGLKGGWSWLTDKVNGLIQGLIDSALSFFDGGSNRPNVNSPHGRGGRMARNTFRSVPSPLGGNLDLINALNGGTTISNSSSYSRNVTQNFYSDGLTSPFEAYRKAMIYGY